MTIVDAADASTSEEMFKAAQKFRYLSYPYFSIHLEFRLIGEYELVDNFLEASRIYLDQAEEALRAYLNAGTMHIS